MADNVLLCTADVLLCISRGVKAKLTTRLWTAIVDSTAADGDDGLSRDDGLSKLTPSKCSDVMLTMTQPGHD